MVCTVSLAAGRMGQSIGDIFDLETLAEVFVSTQHGFSREPRPPPSITRLWDMAV